MTFIELTPEQLTQTIILAVRAEISKMQAPQPDRLVSRKERANDLNVSLPTLMLWERTGKIPPAIRKGTRVYFRGSDLLK